MLNRPRNISTVIIMFINNILCFLLLHINCNNNRSSLILYNTENQIPGILDFYKTYISGSDMRTSENYEEKQTNFSKLLNYHQKNGWLKKLESKNYTEEEKAEIIKNEIESAYRPFDITAGGLMDDWLRNDI